MLRTIIVNPDRELNASLGKVLAETNQCNLLRILDRYPGPMELSRVLRAHAPQLVLLGDRSPEQFLSTSAQIQQAMPGIQVVAVGRDCSAESLMQVMRAGTREYLAVPFPREIVGACLDRCADALSKQPVTLSATDLVYCFLPAKPGSGATTLALNASAAASDPDSANTLLADFDLNSGLLRFLLKLNTANSVLDALAHSQTLDEILWPQLVSHAGNVHVLHGGVLNPDVRIDATQVQHLLDFARRHYKLICLDLSGNLEKYSIELMHESKGVFLVCTPEVASVHLAREKVQYLNRIDLGGHVSVLLNRYHRGCQIHPQDVERLVGAPVALTFPNDYARVSRAVQKGSPVEVDSVMGQQCAALAELMLEKDVHPVLAKRRFVEYFSLIAGRCSVENRRA